jgi:hypothetical protein
VGMEQKVEFGDGGCPAFAAVAELLAQSKFPIQLRMIDGELAFPNEVPPDTWRELRLGTPAGMITVRRDAKGVELVTWGNADAALRQAWNALTWAFALCSKGTVLTAQGRMSADEYQRRESMPPSCWSEPEA